MQHIFVCDTNAGCTWREGWILHDIVYIGRIPKCMHVYLLWKPCMKLFQVQDSDQLRTRSLSVMIWIACSYGNCNYMYAKWHYLMRYWMFHLASSGQSFKRHGRTRGNEDIFQLWGRNGWDWWGDRKWKKATEGTAWKGQGKFVNPQSRDTVKTCILYCWLV